jgi:hypothetical protein
MRRGVNTTMVRVSLAIGVWALILLGRPALWTVSQLEHGQNSSDNRHRWLANFVLLDRPDNFGPPVWPIMSMRPAAGPVDEK